MKRLLVSLGLILALATPAFAFDLGDCGIKDMPMTFKGSDVKLLVCTDSCQICTQAFIFGRRGLEFIPGLDCDAVAQRVSPPPSHHDYYPCREHGVCKR